MFSAVFVKPKFNFQPKAPCDPDTRKPFEDSFSSAPTNLLPLYFGICPDSLKEKVFANIYSKIRIESKGHINTGLIGTQYLFRGLSEYGQNELAYTLASNNTYPSYGYMVANGATTIWELWNGNTANPGMNLFLIHI